MPALPRCDCRPQLGQYPHLHRPIYSQGACHDRTIEHDSSESLTGHFTATVSTDHILHRALPPKPAAGMPVLLYGSDDYPVVHDVIGAGIDVQLLNLRTVSGHLSLPQQNQPPPHVGPDVT